MEIRPKVFCSNCREYVNYDVSSKTKNSNANGIIFSYIETAACCSKCGNLVYVGGIHDVNYLARNRAYFNKFLDRQGVCANGNC